jgi:regulator of replication initiation timing
VPSITIKLITSAHQTIGSVALDLPHGDERAVRQAIHQLFEYRCSETQIDQQLKRQPNSTELTRLRMQQNITLHLAVSKPLSTQPSPGQDTVSKAKDACLIAIRDGLRELQQPIGSTTNPETYRAALLAVGTRLRQQDLWLRDVGLALMSADPQRYVQSVHALQSQIRQQEETIAEQQDDLSQKQQRIAQLDVENRRLREDLQRHKEALTQARAAAEAAKNEPNQPEPGLTVRAAGSGRI